MANKLKEIKELDSGLSYDKYKYLEDEHIEWLIKQAEKLEALGSFTEEESPKYDTLPVAIDKVIKDETIDDKTKIERIDAYVDVWFGWQEPSESDYM